MYVIMACNIAIYQTNQAYNKRLQQMIGMNATEKVGAKWSLSKFMTANWGNKINGLEKDKED
jgi:hypothetical protein